MATFAEMVDGAVQRAIANAAPFVPSQHQYEVQFEHVMYFLDDLSDPWTFIKATHRGAGTHDARVSEMYKKTRRIATEILSHLR